MNEETYKLALVKHYYSLNPECMTLEMPFLAGQRRADAVVVYKETLHGIEIKSDLDKLDSLPLQIADYSKVFDYVWLLISKNHLSNARSALPEGIGLIVIEDGKLKNLRKAKQIKRLNKKALSLSLDRTSLVALLNEFGIRPAKNDGVDSLCDKAESRATIKDLRRKLRFQVVRKFQQGYNTFLRESGQSIHYEDLLNLGLHREIR